MTDTKEKMITEVKTEIKDLKTQMKHIQELLNRGELQTVLQQKVNDK